MKKKEEKKQVVEELSEEELKKANEELAKEREKEELIKEWTPKTLLGKKVLAGEVKSIEEILLSNTPILEPEIVDYLLDLDEKVVEVKKTTRVVRAGRKFSFRATVLVGDRNGHVGVGTGKHAE
ncbi:MAG: hypothetical protein J7L14_04005, partial [Candidatus Diapherotrites archaeon]|nr:hypothetical protein [Candidatus Diapherotrites archaeon]